MEDKSKWYDFSIWGSVFYGEKVLSDGCSVLMEDCYFYLVIFVIASSFLVIVFEPNITLYPLKYNSLTTSNPIPLLPPVITTFLLLEDPFIFY